MRSLAGIATAAQRVASYDVLDGEFRFPRIENCSGVGLSICRRKNASQHQHVLMG